MKELAFAITTAWDGTPLHHKPIEFKVSAPIKHSVEIDVSGPLFNDPEAPQSPPGKSCPELWEYEVAEIFFLGEEEKYLEIELCPHGQYLVLLLNGTRCLMKDNFDLEYTANIDVEHKQWNGTAIVPLDYFPPRVNRMNAYAIHGSGNSRQYEALYPASKEFTTPDFHRLQFFKTCDFKALFPAHWSQSDSAHWKASSE